MFTRYEIGFQVLFCPNNTKLLSYYSFTTFDDFWFFHSTVYCFAKTSILCTKFEVRTNHDIPCKSQSAWGVK